MQKYVVIFGAGPAGLTAAFELFKKTDLKPIIYEMDNGIGGIMRTRDYKGNRIDPGGHRFFSKSEKIIRWWLDIFPLQQTNLKDELIEERKLSFTKDNDIFSSEKKDKVMLIRNRVSRIYFLGRFFEYPITLSLRTFLNLGFIRTVKIVLSYIKIKIFPIKEENTLEEFFINRFCREFYFMFFKEYTEKVWGIHCNKIRPDWLRQRVKGLSLTKAVIDAIKSTFFMRRSTLKEEKRNRLSGQFMYPKFGAGQFWEEVAMIVKKKGGQIYLNHRVIGLTMQDNKIIEVKVKEEISGNIITKKGDYFISTMPIDDLIRAFGKDIPQNVINFLQELKFRDFITVGLLIKNLKIKNDTKIRTPNNLLPDNWIYIPERNVKLGRIQIFNNWSP